MKAISYIASSPVQEALELLFVRATASTLDVERRHAEAKKWEASKLTHVAIAARNCFLQRYAREEFGISDFGSDSAVSVDTDAETAQSDSDSEYQDDVTIAKEKAQANAVAEDEAGPSEKLKRPPLWSNNYFDIGQ